MEELFTSILTTILERFRDVKVIPNQKQYAMIGYQFCTLKIQSNNPSTITLEYYPIAPTIAVIIYPAINSFEKHMLEQNPEISDDRFQFSHEKKRLFIIDKPSENDHFGMSYMSLLPDTDSTETITKSEIISRIMALLSESDFGRDC